MTYVLYGDRGSGSCIVECALAEIGVAYESRDVSISRDQQREADYGAVNPHRKLPTLISPTGETLTESAAIVLTLADRHPETRLLPIDPAERAHSVRWLIFVATELYPIVEINDYPQRFAPDAESAPAVREIARQHWRTRWSIVEQAIAGDPWLCTSGFCIADIYIAVVSRWGQQGEWRSVHLPKVEAVAAGVAKRNACGPVWHRHFGIASHSAPGQGL